MIEMFCNHKYGEVKGNYQYCLSCGKAIAAPTVDCTHNWKQVTSYTMENTFRGNIYKSVIVLQCQNCGDVKKIDLQ
jgi:uncharacterized OB-fold protein